MRRFVFFQNVLTLLLVLTMLCSALSLTVYAAPDGGDTEVSADSGDSGELPADDGAGDTGSDDAQSGDAGDPISDDPGEPAEEPTEAPADNGADGNGYNDYIDNIDDIDADSSYEEPEYLDELPTVSSGEVIEPTAVVLPDVEVTDASLFSGTVMWLCVAVGIAVVVGVMVSKRTRGRR